MIYQPFPFEIRRKDCEDRYKVIAENLEKSDKTLIDICCANGYFGFRFLQNGGAEAVGIEINPDYITLVNVLAKIEQLSLKCQNNLPDRKFDLGIYLDTHYASGTEDYLLWLKNNVRKCFTSCCHADGDFLNRNDDYERLLNTMFSTVRPIYKGFAGRIIFRCE